MTKRTTTIPTSETIVMLDDDRKFIFRTYEGYKNPVVKINGMPFEVISMSDFEIGKELTFTYDMGIAIDMFKSGCCIKSIETV